jgi:hypothetical protein
MITIFIVLREVIKGRELITVNIVNNFLTSTKTSNKIAIKKGIFWSVSLYPYLETRTHY